MLQCFKGTRDSGETAQGKVGAGHACQDSDESFNPVKRTSRTTHISSWITVSSSGETNLEEANPYAAARKYDISIRDVNLVVSKEGISCPVRLAARNKAILACFEGLRIIIREDSVLIVSTPLGSLEAGGTPFSDSPAIRDLVSRLRISSFPDRSEDFVDKSLPFELLVLEWALGMATKMLAEEVQAFEEAALPQLDEIGQKITHQNINKLRKIKYRASHLSFRLGRYKQEVGKVLSSDNRLVKTNLSHLSSPGSNNTRGGFRASGRWRISQQSNSPARQIRGRERRAEQQPLFLDPGASAEACSLVECYFLQVEAALSSLRAITSSSGSTEDMVKMSMKLQRVRIGHR